MVLGSRLGETSPVMRSHSPWITCPSLATVHRQQGKAENGKESVSAGARARGFSPLFHAWLFVVPVGTYLAHDPFLVQLLLQPSEGALDRLSLAYFNFGCRRIHAVPFLWPAADTVGFRPRNREN